MGKYSGVFVLSDLDGTLLNSNREISRKNIEAIRDFMNQGGLFAFATGRSRPAVEYFIADININAPAVICNGCVAYDFQLGRHIHLDPLPDIAAELTDDLLATFPDVGMELGTLQRVYALNMNPITKLHMEHVKIPMDIWRHDAVNRPWINLLLTRREEDMPALKAYIEAKYGKELFLQYSAAYFLEVQNKTANKGECAGIIRDKMGIRPENLHVIGDGQNDVQLLSCTDNIYAPENACPEIMALNPRIMPSNDDSCVAALIESL